MVLKLLLLYNVQINCNIYKLLYLGIQKTESRKYSLINATQNETEDFLVTPNSKYFLPKEGAFTRRKTISRIEDARNSTLDIVKLDKDITNEYNAPVAFSSPRRRKRKERSTVIIEVIILFLCDATLLRYHLKLYLNLLMFFFIANITYKTIRVCNNQNL